MCKVRTFLYCAELRTGALVVGILGIFFNFFFFILACTTFEVPLPQSIQVEIYIFAAVDILMSLIMIGASTILTVGILNVNRTLVRPWSYGAMAYCVLRSSMIALLFICIVKKGPIAWIVFSLLFNVLYTVILIYSIAVTCSYFSLIL